MECGNYAAKSEKPKKHHLNTEQTKMEQNETRDDQIFVDYFSAEKADATSLRRDSLRTAMVLLVFFVD